MHLRPVKFKFKIMRRYKIKIAGQNLRLICRLSNKVRIHLFSPFLALNVLYWSQKSGQRSRRLRVVLNAVMVWTEGGSISFQCHFCQSQSVPRRSNAARNVSQSADASR
jgi:hypothetical protein